MSKSLTSTVSKEDAIIISEQVKRFTLTTDAHGTAHVLKENKLLFQGVHLTGCLEGKNTVSLISPFFNELQFIMGNYSYYPKPIWLRTICSRLYKSQVLSSPTCFKYASIKT